MTTHLPTRKRTYTRWLAALGCVLTLAFSMLCGLVLHNIGVRDRATAEKSAANIVAPLTTDMARNFDLYSLSLSAVSDGLAVPGVWSLRDDVRHLLLFDRATTAQHLGDIFALDAMGQMVVSSNEKAPIENKA